MVSTLISIPGYRISEELYNGSRTIVYRAVRETDSVPVVIKLLKNPYPSFSELLLFRNQYTIGKNLNSPLIIQTYSLESLHNGYMLVMEDFGGISLKDYFSKNQRVTSREEFLVIAIALCDILDLLYHERIIHKDIKPSNILINPETKQVKLIDFSIASLLPRETQTLVNPNVLEGTLAYISPEQTGRMNRGIDYRTDFYSLGVTFYELLTGELPFASNDAMELVHCHIAKHPPLIHEINPDIPSVISEIVGKLMAKNAEDRYQSALGLKFDLEKCLIQLKETGEIQSFEIGQRDVCDRFIIPDTLYGRETEVQTLLEAFERVSQGATEIMLVAGFSGIGKTAVVNEVHKPIVRQRGYFIKGKYDQFQQNIPFSAFVQAFRDLMGQLLSEFDAQLQIWKTKILEVVGENGQVLIDVIPELEHIIGAQPPATELSGTAAENRFNLLLQKFVQVFTNQEHPLVMFLDDLQWADSASLKLLQLLMQDTKYLLLLGAYRDNEVSSTHSFIMTIDELKKSEVLVNKIILQPLSEAKLNQLVADTLNCELLPAQSLTTLIYQKTKGNPFFSTQFLKALNNEQLITFDFASRNWQCDIARIKALAITDDVVEFMSLQLQKFPQHTQNILKLAACIGAQFDLQTLAIISEQVLEATAADLWKALQEGLIIPNTKIYKFFVKFEHISSDYAAANPVYRFLHDRVQQAAYSLIPDEKKQVTHLKIGQLLLQNSAEIEREEKLFDIVGHLNQGQVLIHQPQERKALAKLNLKAGNKARNSTAYTAAREYFQTGIELLEINCWQSQYELALNLYIAATEASYLNGDFDAMEQLAFLVLQQAQSIIDKVKIYEIQIAALTASSQILAAIAVGREALAQLGVELPSQVDETQIRKALAAVNQQLQSREIAALIDLPLMSEPQAQAAIQILSMLFPPVLLGIPGLMPILGATMVRLSLEFGNTPASIPGYAIHGMVMCAFFGEVEIGYEFGKLALSLLEKLNVPGMKCITLNLFGAFIHHHRQALLTTLIIQKESYRAGMENGDFLYAGYSIQGYAFGRLFTGAELNALADELHTYSTALAQFKQDSARIYLDMVQQTVAQFRETVSQSDRLIGTFYDETVMFPKHEQDRDLTAFAFTYNYKLLLAYSFGNYHAALEYITQFKSYLMAVSGMFLVPLFHFYAALTHLALVSTEPEKIFAEVETHQKTLHQWAENAPMNHLHKWHLVEAEKCRVCGDKLAAMEHYEQAITLAKTHQFLNEEALANELAAKFYLDWDKEKIAQTYMMEAYYCYARWGAKAKVIDLERRYPQLLLPILHKQQPTFKPTETILSISSHTIQSSSLSNTSLSQALDLATIIKAFQSLSCEIELEKLLSTLLQVILENAGADKCALLMPKGDCWVIEALSQFQQRAIILQSLPCEEIVSVSLINRVKNTLVAAVVENAVVEPTLLADPYILHHAPKSIFCAPILNQGKLMGILYLENNLTLGAFTSERIEILNLLCTQAAISLENAKLYHQLENYSHNLEQKVAERTQELTTKATQLESTLNQLYSTQAQLIQAEKMSSLGQLVAGIAHEINNPINFIYGNLSAANEYVTSLIELNHLYQSIYPQTLPEIAQKIADIDLEFILNDLPNLLSSMKVGAERIRQIVLSLRNFSRLDESEIKEVDIHSGLESTLLILQHRLQSNSKRPEIILSKQYGVLPLVNCYASALNQVFMNIINNAIDALETSDNNRQPTIMIKTELTETKNVIIRIADNGIGMNQSVQNQIFNPFFTTKPVGSGTGLGLSTSYSIVVEKHCGQLSCISAPGEGTEFIIKIPV
ncbi:MULTISPECIES: trifunctional serine/threonine-protein kinase/ATP-binding protein/sensor histidine kinase [unclassified Tolypothrix]|uniref:trifunctional serine/threonine-protein kinase/ATP-binding protein/sensor histidine kinase n=1 Tax=unclassified Tolypothrix TaxID=2649714 RepID=UPI0005EAAB30|nr:MULTISPECIES: ATP-binding sensor histidine kinase [unclassified Tolypothrix]BAY92902.1 serine/threonine protein kinase with two-component sensor domain [Microchaete diplosiphon NIES-3275]EKF03003.1 ATPase, histidine kinase-, DNA gyrase B-, and HSP90-like domain protein [Tolypothrix sp. PCC 7601]MBE9082272.1 AAA family ATPase [Tolypothrix sp. LEGE 11397]UYD26807.1 AAA family ATPase [Tolypothrix sp. PCC 7712]UYD37336.1 AAA family ATPase [Tolypothrix sp. PCC 7601]